MGLFDLLSPALTPIDAGLAVFLPDLARLVLWGLVSSVICMGLYCLSSSQQKMAELKVQIAEVRGQINAYDGPFAGVQPLLMRSIRLSLRQCWLSLGPAVIGSLPVLFLLAWLSESYGYRLPEPGDPLAYEVVPAAAVVRWNPPLPASGQPASAPQVVPYPAADASRTLEDQQQRELLSLPLRIAAPVIGKRVWWNLFFGNAAGYLPQDTPVDRVEFQLQRRQFLPLSLAWLGYWETVYFTVLIVGSLGIKIAFKIH